MPAVALREAQDAAELSGARAAAFAGPAIAWHLQSRAARLIDRVAAGDREVSATVRGLVAPIAERLRRKGRHSPARPADLIDLARDWRTRLNTESRLGFTSDFADKGKGLAITDCRLTSTAFTLRRWPAAEEGLAILLIHFRVAPGTGADLTTEIAAVISKHAIGRRFERGDGDDAAVIADFQRLAAELMTDAKATQCQCPSGVWIGEPVLALGQPTMAIKTFLPAVYTIAWSS